MATTYLFVDGNYTFHLSKSIGVQQSFDKLEANILAAVSSPEMKRKFFYTRPPTETNARPVIGWLRAHEWEVHSFAYQHTHQDSMYVNMVADMYAAYLADPAALFVIVSGSGALTYPLSLFPGNSVVFTTPESINKKLSNVEGVRFFNLTEVL